MKRAWIAFLLFCSLALTLEAGSFKAIYVPPKNPDYVEWQNDMKKEKALEGLADELNSFLTVPTDVKLTFTECGTINAFYSPQDQTIVFCYEFIDYFYKIFEQEGLKDQELEDKVYDATMFFFYHEVGHALIHVLDLPSTGKEEDAVDQLSTWVLADGSDEGEQAALDGAISFYLMAKENEGGDKPFWDEHSLEEQRFFNVLCWVYGQNPDKYQKLVQGGMLPENRAARCSDEWTKLDSSWYRLLEDNLIGDESQETDDSEESEEQR